MCNSLDAIFLTHVCARRHSKEVSSNGREITNRVTVTVTVTVGLIFHTGTVILMMIEGPETALNFVELCRRHTKFAHVSGVNAVASDEVQIPWS